VVGFPQFMHRRHSVVAILYTKRSAGQNEVRPSLIASSSGAGRVRLRSATTDHSGRFAGCDAALCRRHYGAAAVGLGVVVIQMLIGGAVGGRNGVIFAAGSVGPAAEAVSGVGLVSGRVRLIRTSWSVGAVSLEASGAWAVVVVTARWTIRTRGAILD